MLNTDALRQSAINKHPYPYLVLRHAIKPSLLTEVLQDFPAIELAGSVPISETQSGPAFLRLIEQLNSMEFRRIIASKFSVNLKSSPIVTTVRGVMRKKDGRIHTDSKSKIITVLIYFNEQWPHDGGRLRILENNTDINNYVEEVVPMAGTMIAFKVTDNCWHGHTAVEGKRLSLQMNYLVSEAAQNKHHFLHKLSAKFKSLLAKH